MVFQCLSTFSYLFQRFRIPIRQRLGDWIRLVVCYLNYPPTLFFVTSFPLGHVCWRYNNVSRPVFRIQLMITKCAVFVLLLKVYPGVFFPHMKTYHVWLVLGPLIFLGMQETNLSFFMRGGDPSFLCGGEGVAQHPTGGQVALCMLDQRGPSSGAVDADAKDCPKPF